MSNPQPLFVATERFDQSDGEKWLKYFEWVKNPALTEVVSLDCLLCPSLTKEVVDEDWSHIVNADFRLRYFLDLDYLKQKVQAVKRKNILGLYRNTETHIKQSPRQGSFVFLGYDLIEEQTHISALTNCGGFPDAFSNDELNRFGLIENFERACEVRRSLATKHPKEAHAQCEQYAVWRLEDKSDLVEPASA